MDHATAKAIAAEIAPELIVDEANPKMPDLMIVRKVDGGRHFNIHLPSSLPDPEATPAEMADRERATLKDSLASATKYFG